MHNDYAKFMQSDYAKFRQTVVSLHFKALGLKTSTYLQENASKYIHDFCLRNDSKQAGVTIADAHAPAAALLLRQQTKCLKSDNQHQVANPPSSSTHSNYYAQGGAVLTQAAVVEKLSPPDGARDANLRAKCREVVLLSGVCGVSCVRGECGWRSAYAWR